MVDLARSWAHFAPSDGGEQSAEDARDSKNPSPYRSFSVPHKATPFCS